MTDIDVDEKEVFVEEFKVRALMEVDVENLAVTAPVATEVQDDTLMLEAGLLKSCSDVSFGVGLCGVKMLLDRGRRGYRLARGGCCRSCGSRRCSGNNCGLSACALAAEDRNGG